uniref:site-specific integrase n=1 Tax=Paractinoplanes polyasparticus TaxID=2856853 RepID=UPI001C858500|nr:site-specific integrase [Actinoplanes polyasparticus]
MPRGSDPIKRVVLPSGAVRYRFTVDVGQKVKTENGRPVLKDGKPVMVRDQRTHSFERRKDAVEKRSALLADRARGTLVAASKVTVSQHLEDWLAGKRDLKKRTFGNYRDALKPVHEELGQIELQKLSKASVDQLVTRMLASGRRVNRKGTPLAPSTVILMLTVLSMALDDAMAQGLVLRNVARLVERPKATQHEMKTWTAEQAATFLGAIASERLAVGWGMAMYGMRRGEVLGLRWCDVDLVGKSLAIRKTRSPLDGVVIEDDPKTERSKRTLPLDDDLVGALTALQLRQREEAEEAGDAYGACPDCGELHVVVDELGVPVHPESFSDQFTVRVKRAGLPAIRLHDTRHTCGTLMHLRGVPTAVISAWLGHSSASFTMKVYVHSQDEALRAAGATLTGAFRPAPAGVDVG